MSSKETEYSSKSREVVGMQLSVLSPDEIEGRSVVKVTETILYDSNGDPVINGLFDPRMGVIDHGMVCPTDKLDNRMCPGYFGHIELARPVYHIQFFDVTFTIIKCFCIKCSRILIETTDELIDTLSKMTNKKRYTFLTSKCSKNKSCFYCGAVQPGKFIKDGLAKIYAVWNNLALDETVTNEDKRQYMNSEYVLKMFKRITDDDCSLIGLDPKWCRPDWLICVNLPVPPPAVRPSIKQSNNTRSEDDITHKLIDILKTNNHLKKKLDIEASLSNTIEEWTSVLQYHVATLVDNNLPGISPSAHRSGRPLKTIRERLKGKEGRIRGNLMGKRVDHCARSVITPDPNLKLNELGVPYKIAMNLTFPEIVNKYNIGKLTAYVRNGPYKHPGAKSFTKIRDNRTTSLFHVDTSTIELFEGDTVNRHLVDGDPVLFNRQPSLHKMSMMAHNIVVMDYNTFRLNVSVTTPYNADFDGDEMNMHVPQSIQTAVELQQLAAVPLQIISPRVHTPIITLVQDTLLGINRITNDGVYLTKNEIMNILMYIETFDGILPEPEKKNPNKWNGRQLFSMILPEELNLNMKNSSHDDDNGPDELNHVVIKNGILTQGRVDKKILNSGSKGIIHMIFNDYGHKRCQQFLDDVQNIITRYLVITGFSVGVSDLIADKKTNEKIAKTIVQKKKDVSKLVQQLHSQLFDKSADSNIAESFENDVNKILNKAINEAGKIGLQSLDSNNRMTNMVSAGSKGKTINIAQMIACLGQQNVDGKRIPNGFNDRTLPHFSKYDVSPNAKGFVENSFIKGLSPEEFFFHAMGGREGLIDTAVKTSETGYIQRKLIKAMEDLKTSYDLSVRNADGNIIQFVYGEDGFDYCKIETQSLEYFKEPFEKIEEHHRFQENEKWNILINNSTIKELKSVSNYKDKLEQFFKIIIEDYRMINEDIFKTYEDTSVHIPINMFRLIQNAKNKYEIIGTNISNINPIYIIDEINNLLDNLYINSYNKCNELFNILIRNYLSPKQIIKKHRLSKGAFDYIILSIKKQFEVSKVECNEMVGPIAAQSIGEPATQMTLNTFHFAGVSSKSNVTRGVPRLKELLHLSKTLKSPSLSIYLHDHISKDKTQAKNILNSMELTKLSDILKSVNIYYDPDDFNTTIEEDRELLQIYKIFSQIDESMISNCNSKWIIRLELDKEKMVNKDITMELVYHKINMYYHTSDDVSCIYTDDNSNKLIFRIRVKIQKKADKNKINDINYLKNIIKTLQDKVIIKGVNGIDSVSMFKSKKNTESNKSYKKVEEWVLDTKGVNMIEIMQNKFVDKTRTISNDIYEVYNLLGIEAARQVLMDEIRDVISSAGSYVNYRHLSLLADIMTSKGTLMSIDRFGINRGNIGPLAKCSFEETTDQLFKASIYGELDKLNGVSSNIMMGQIAPCGTGSTEVYLDESKLMEMYYKPDEKIGDIETWEEQEDLCDMNIGIDYDIANINADNNTDIPVISIE